MFAETLVAVCKRFYTGFADQSTWPERISKINPFLASVGADRAVKKLVDTQVCCVDQSNQVRFCGGFLLHEEAELRIKSFQLSMRSVPLQPWYLLQDSRDLGRAHEDPWTYELRQRVYGR